MPLGRVEEPSSAALSREEGVIPVEVKLHPNYPNPFNPNTTIPFSLNKPSRIRLEIYSSTGRRVKVLLAKELGAGEYQVIWDGTNQVGSLVASGSYYCRLSGSDFMKTQTLTLLK